MNLPVAFSIRGEIIHGCRIVIKKRVYFALLELITIRTKLAWQTSWAVPYELYHGLNREAQK